MAQVTDGCVRGQVSNQPKVVGMQMCDKQVSFRQVNPQFPQGREHDILAFGTVHTRIDNQVPILSYDYIRVN
jgi:hypothetical protein